MTQGDDSWLQEDTSWRKTTRLSILRSPADAGRRKGALASFDAPHRSWGIYNSFRKWQ